MPSRYLIGIDLGTTNSAVAYVDTQAADPRVRVFEVPQLVAPGEVAPRRQLPSFVYLASDIDLAPHETALPWRADAPTTALRAIVGELARNQGARMASRMIASAKSWLCHPGVDRSAAILPWGDSDGPKLSPINAQAQVLRHIREAWDYEHPDAPFEEQEILVTVPASFDEAARELTLQAATAAGYPAAVLLEEPQAAFYAWIDNARTKLGPGERVLVFDVGGGTTDFTLIEVDENGDGFTRTAVGDHLLLGGDNLDLTLAKIVEQRVVARTNKKLDALQWHGLVHACRLAKETLLGDSAPDTAPIVVQARGAKLIGGTIRDEVTRAELDKILFDGFFPLVEKCAQLVRGRGAWHHGRVVLLGDAGYCPALLTGYGSTLAMIGAYILAGELSATPDDYRAAFQRYEQIFKPYVEKEQKKLQSGADFLIPGTPLGLWARNHLAPMLARAVLVPEGIVRRLHPWSSMLKRYEEPVQTGNNDNLSPERSRIS